MQAARMMRPCFDNDLSERGSEYQLATSEALLTCSEVTMRNRGTINNRHHSSQTITTITELHVIRQRMSTLLRDVKSACN